MRKPDDQIASIKSKLQLILKQHSQVLKENEVLKNELRAMKEERLKYQQELEELKQRSEIWKYSHGAMDEAERKLMEKKLTAYIREIDRCIAMLGA